MARHEKNDIALNPLTGKIDLFEANAPEDRAEQELMTIKSAFGDDQYRVTYLMGQRAGRKQITTAIQKTLTVTDLIDLKTIKESKQYKGFKHILPSGESVTITTFEEYCIHVEGRSYEAINMDLKNFQQMGEEFFDAMRQIGIGPATMRDYRKLPDDDKQALLEVAHNGDKDSFVELASALISKHQKAKEADEKLITKLVDQLEAKDGVIKEKTEELNKKSERINLLEAAKRKTVDEANMPGEYQLMRLQEYTRDITVRIAATLNKEIVLLFKEFPDAIPPQHIELAARQSIGLIISAAYGVADNMGIDPILEAKEADDLPAKADAEAFLEWQAKQQVEQVNMAGAISLLEWSAGE